ncbi:hypothetical protein DVDV_1643 [Desulfovibrio sp. DV]|nr:hypothetical protein DVDV_1643 [Desulfovibrio sp. DV]
MPATGLDEKRLFRGRSRNPRDAGRPWGFSLIGFDGVGPAGSVA